MLMKTIKNFSVFKYPKLNAFSSIINSQFSTNSIINEVYMFVYLFVYLNFIFMLLLFFLII